MMKRVLLLVLLVGLFAGQASAAMYMIDPATSQTFGQVATSGDSIFFPLPSPGSTLYVALDGILPKPDGSVLFKGDLMDGSDPDSTGWVLIGGNVSVTNSSFGVGLRNDDNSTWSFYAAVHVVGEGATTYHYGSGLDLAPHQNGLATVTFGTDVTVDQVGFYVQGFWPPDPKAPGGVNQPSNPDDFNVSVVPVPGALLIGLLGLSAAGIKLRRFA
jgi:hypothetical protein